MASSKGKSTAATATGNGRAARARSGGLRTNRAAPPVEVVAPSPTDEVVAPSPKDEVVAPSPKDEVVAPSPKDEVVAPSPKDEEASRPVAAPVVSVRTPARRIAIVAGLRTPFVLKDAALRELSALDLGRLVVVELLARSGIDASAVEQLVFGQALPGSRAVDVAREVVLGAGLPRSTDAFSVSRACATSMQALVSVAQSIESGLVRGGIAGGAESASDEPIVVPRRLSSALRDARAARSLVERLSAFRHVRPRDLVPVAPPSAEPSTGMSLGEHAEVMARDWGVGRERQDDYARRSHARASAAWDEGRLADDVMHVYVPPRYDAVQRDDTARAEIGPDDYAALAPAFDARHGTITEATSAPPADGAAALLVMREDRAAELGLRPLGYLRSYAFAAVDPREHLLMGPAYAAPLALERAGVTLADLDLVELHEAFAAQVLCNVAALESEAFARDKLGRSAAVGKIDLDVLNPNGGSLACGHPLAATGARLVLSALAELRRRGGSLALCATPARGGLGAAVVLEAAS